MATHAQSSGALLRGRRWNKVFTVGLAVPLRIPLLLYLLLLPPLSPFPPSLSLSSLHPSSLPPSYISLSPSSIPPPSLPLPSLLLPSSLGEQSRVDHLVFLVHGIGAHYDLNFRNLVDCGEHGYDTVCWHYGHTIAETSALDVLPF